MNPRPDLCLQLGFTPWNPSLGTRSPIPVQVHCSSHGVQLYMRLGEDLAPRRTLGQTHLWRKYANLWHKVGHNAGKHHWSLPKTEPPEACERGTSDDVKDLDPVTQLIRTQVTYECARSSTQVVWSPPAIGPWVHVGHDECSGLNIQSPLPRDPDATPRGWIPHRGLSSQGYRYVEPRSEALLSPWCLRDAAGRVAFAALRRISPRSLGPRPNLPYHDHGLIADCHISRSIGWHSRACSPERLVLAGHNRSL